MRGGGEGSSHPSKSRHLLPSQSGKGDGEGRGVVREGRMVVREVMVVVSVL